MPYGFEWVVSPEDAFIPGAEQYVRAVNDAVFQTAVEIAPDIQSWMQENAPWTDRTGNARQGLFVFASRSPDGVVLTLSHGVWYGIHLETSYQGRYAIIAPSVDYWGPIVLALVQDLLQ
jgi:hypothetical protein